MPKYVIERTVPGVGKWTAAEIKAASQKSNGVLRTLGNDIQWVHSYVVDDKIYCIYNAANPDIIVEHARCAGFPAERISEVRAIIDPVSGES